MQLTPIGIIHSPHPQATGTPVQSAFAQSVEGTVELFPAFAGGLKDLAGFERIWLITWLDRAAPARLEVVPYLDTEPHGIFATRSPCRPNPIGLSPVRLLGIDGGTLRVSGLDLLDGTPVLDVKPYVPAFDAFNATRIGWYGQVDAATPKLADERFSATP
jgi:tRNA-Thr(GGU) m(6)t(6)A37 methyltransferase TsaA